ncbi:type I restriction-modification system subunit M [Nostoc cf. commune SO-36]|uniref:site-specific DNA-methyltransferase (adenine-specific) n=1 Tax=Nostoc cf. commune SO-36 TaxID=449208 RepID=A0ABN6Q1I5_NOSCO|nr:type I restriction-modification system subunit M [Nostoc commune]BDI15202.1 type I restriction-modification system subunit M [Nostoc cf. commune SO-36]
MITLEYLEDRLWTAVSILRGVTNGDDYINYLFRLLLIKRFSDLFEEESHKAKPRFFVPAISQWNYLQQIPENIGQALNEAGRAIEIYNPGVRELQIIFINYNFEHSHSQVYIKKQDQVLRQLIWHLSEIKLQNKYFGEPDLLGKGCEYLISQFAANLGKKSGEFFTPQKVAELLVSLLEPQPGMSICDPFCGFGGILTECIKQIKHLENKPNDLLLYGQDINQNTFSLAKINLLLHDIFNFDIRLGDIIREPQLVENGNLMLFDRVISNPPFSIRDWGYELAKFDVYGRFRYGIPPKGSGDFAFIQHILATLKNTGKAGVIVPLGVLFRGGAESEIRTKIIESDLIEAVIGLAGNLFYGTGIPTAILIFNRDKQEDRRNKVLFINASNEYQKSRNQNYLREEDITHIITAYQAFQDEEGYAKVVALEELAANEYILNINRYVLTPKDENDKIDIEAEIIKLRELEAQRAEAEKDINKYLRQLGIKLSD